MIATTAITEETPIRIPSTVRNERSLFARSDDERDAARPQRTAWRSGRASVLLVALDLAVPDVDDAVRVLGDVALVRHQDDRVAVARAASRTAA